MQQLTTKEIERLKHTMSRALDLIESGTSETPPADWFETAEIVRNRLYKDLEIFEQKPDLDSDFFKIGGTS
jgi:hypothetical protein